MSSSLMFIGFFSWSTVLQIFEKLDTSLEGFFSDNDEFIKGWFQVRKIKGRPDRRKTSTQAA